MIAEANPLITAAAVAMAVVGSTFIGRGRQAAAPEPLSGVLYSLSADTQAARVAAVSMPEIDIGLDPAARAALPRASALVVRFVGLDESTFTLTLARHIHEDSAPKVTSSKTPSPITRSIRRSTRRKLKTSEKVVPVVAAAGETTPASAPMVAPPSPPMAAPPSVPVVAPPSAPKPTFPPTFSEIDDALRASSTAQAINFRVKKGGITFRLTQVDRIGERYVIRYAIANEEPDPFFMSIVNVAASGKPIQSETAGSYSCATGQEVYGVVHFKPATVAGKTVVVELVQSGGEHRRFSLSADYAF